MGKGTPAKGLHNKKTHIRCRRCGRTSFHVRHKLCAACGFGKTTRIRRYNWQTKKVMGRTRIV
ncbi:MAG: 50S ribosomal protein L37e [Candidatus Lokiarchaeota archaeon]|nr:50S ribosomal protein L37e [Candidatus Lokiarchaeota archaeon]